MATDDNVVRLKHLSSLASSIAAEIATLSGGSSGGSSSASAPNNADFALYVPNNTSIIVTGKQTPELSIGSWSYAGNVNNAGNSAKIYSAPVTYSGDGTLSTDNGTISNGTLTVHDSDGIFDGVISASAGNNYASSSLYFNHDLDLVTVSSDANINNAIQSVGAKFIPAVDNAEDFANYADQNIQFFDNRLKKLIDGGRDYEPYMFDEAINALDQSPSDGSFLNGRTTVFMVYGDPDRLCYLRSSMDYSSVSTEAYTSSSYSVPTSLSFYKLTERNGLVLYQPKGKNGDYRYPMLSKASLFYFNDKTDALSIATLNNIIATPNSSLASCEGSQTISALNSPKYNSILFVGKSTDKHKTYGTTTVCRATKINSQQDKTGTTTTARTYIHSLNTMTIYGALNGATVTHANYFDFAKAYAPVTEFNGEAVSISKGSTPKDIPILLFDSVRSDSSGNDTIGRSFAYFGVEDSASLSCCTLTSIATVDTIFADVNYSAGDTITLNHWVEDDGSVILGLYPGEYNNQYIVTYKEGSYTKSNWLNNAFDVWIVENTASPKFTKSTKKITDVADELIV